MTEKIGPLPDADMPRSEWLQKYFPNVCTHPEGERHTRLWEWIEGVKPGDRPRPHFEIWGRGGAKSSTAELGCARVGAKLARRFCLYVCETQEQADLHVQAISTLFESLNVERALNKYGHSKGWRRNQLRTANGFNVAALGLDTAARGIKLDEFRPDFIVFDDIDNAEDTLKTLDKKIRHITKKILPAGSSSCAILGVQNLIWEDGIFAQLEDGRADFLHDRFVSPLEPAVRGLEYQAFPDKDKPERNIYRITGGEATWSGQSLAVCEAQINEWGLGAFLEEAQHEVRGVGGYMFNTPQFRSVRPDEVPPLVAIGIGGDLAATEGGGDHTVLVVIGKGANGLWYVLAVVRGQWSPERVNVAIKRTTSFYKAHFPGLILELPQDPAQGGKWQAHFMQRGMLGEHVPQMEAVGGSKAKRAYKYAEEVNLGNVCLVTQDLPNVLKATDPETGPKPLMTDLRWEKWHQAYKFVLKRFDENVLDQPDDDVDASSIIFNRLAGYSGERVSRRGTGGGYV